MADTNGVLVARYQYDPYGNLLGMSGPLAEANAFRFSSKEWCANAGLYYYGYRFYEPNFHRWLNRDLAQEFGGLNLFQFVFNNAVGWIDPYGLDIKPLPVTPLFPRLDPGWPFSDPCGFAGSKKPLHDFGNACRKQMLDYLKHDEDFQDFKDQLVDQYVAPLLYPVKEFFGLGPKPESLGIGGPSRKKNKWDVDFKWLGATLSYDMHKYGKFQLKGSANTGGGLDDFYKIDGGNCKFEYNLSF